LLDRWLHATATTLLAWLTTLLLPLPRLLLENDLLAAEYRACRCSSN
jgi:hypothetical protein